MRCPGSKAAAKVADRRDPNGSSENGSPTQERPGADDGRGADGLEKSVPERGTAERVAVEGGTSEDTADDEPAAGGTVPEGEPAEGTVPEGEPAEGAGRIEEDRAQDSRPPRRTAAALRVVLGLLLLLLVLVGLGIAALLFTLPDVSEYATRWPTTTPYMELRIREARAEGRELAIRYHPVPLNDIPEQLQRAVRVSEDAAFFQHRGFDWYEMRMAIREAWTERESPRGASTITQQLARNLYLSPERNLIRKLREALITERLEARLTKRRILELYLNVIELGPGIFGVEAASQRYFGKPVAEVSAANAAELAATIPAPLRHNPATDTRDFRWRVELVYQRAFGPGDSLAVTADSLAVTADSGVGGMTPETAEQPPLPFPDTAEAEPALTPPDTTAPGAVTPDAAAPAAVPPVGG